LLDNPTTADVREHEAQWHRVVFYDKEIDEIHNNVNLNNIHKDNVQFFDPFCGSGGASLNHYTVPEADPPQQDRRRADEACLPVFVKENVQNRCTASFKVSRALKTQ
jgi:hypothetical protein